LILIQSPNTEIFNLTLKEYNDIYTGLRKNQIKNSLIKLKPTKMARQIIIAIPPTTAYTVVFPFDAIGKRFDSGFYSPGVTDGRATIEEINHVLADIENTRRPIASKIMSAICCYIISLLAVVGCYVFGMVSIAGTSPESIPFLVIGFIVAVIAVIWVFIARVRKVNEELKTKCQEVANRHNQNFSSRGLRWHIPVHFPRWVELWKDYVNQGQGQNFPGQQPVYMPPVQQQPYANYGGPQQQNMGGQPQFQQNYYQNYQGQPNNNNMYIPPNQV